MSHTALYLIAFLVAFCLLVTVHEFGHFWVARRLGFKVLRFSVGFGKPLWKHVAADGCEYWLASVPLGGYVKMVDEREGPVAPEDLPRAFTRRPHWQRIVVLLAGPFFNILFAVLVMTAVLFASGITQVKPVLGQIQPTSLLGRAGLASGDQIVAIDSRPVHAERDVEFGLLDAISGGGPVTIRVRSSAGLLHTAVLRIPDAAQRLRLTDANEMDARLGLQFYQPPLPALIAKVLPGTPAAHAGLAAGDRILAVDGQGVQDFAELSRLIESHPGQSVTVRYRRGDRVAAVSLTPAAQIQDGRRVGTIGIEVSAAGASFPPGMLQHINLSLPGAFVHASAEAWRVTALQGRMVWRMLVNKVSIKNLSGPLSIAEYAGSAAAAGPSAFLSFLVLLSLVLGFMNLLPIPMLDGGQIVFQGIEWLKGSPLSERFQMVTNQLGLALLVLLMGVALFNDLSQFG